MFYLKLINEWNDNVDTWGLPHLSAPCSLASSYLIQRACSTHSSFTSSSSSTNKSWGVWLTICSSWLFESSLPLSVIGSYKGNNHFNCQHSTNSIDLKVPIFTALCTYKCIWRYLINLWWSENFSKGTLFSVTVLKIKSVINFLHIWICK